MARIPPVTYVDPWSAGYEERLARLRSGSPRIAYFYTRPDTSTFRYRVYNMIEALGAAEPDASAAWFTAEDGRRAADAIEHADLLVVCRALYSKEIAALITRARAARTPVLFDVDDLIFDARYTHLIMDSLDQTVDEPGLDHWFAYISRVAATLRLCDGAITTNDYLADRLRDVHDVPTRVVPNFLNRWQLEVSNRVLRAKEASGFARDERIHIGYFSGTPTHNRDFAIAEPAIVRLLDEDPRVRLRVVGFLQPSEQLSAYGDRVEVLPLQDFVNLQRLIGEVEINVIPVQDNEFTNCKSELKYFEAGVVGTISVASPTYCLRRSIHPGETGFVTAAHNWDSALREAVAEADDAHGMAEAAAADAVERYSPEAQGPALRRALLELATMGRH